MCDLFFALHKSSVSEDFCYYLVTIYSIQAHVYQVTITAARAIPEGAHCQDKNETLCIMNNKRFCFTSGVVCDGIKNCGATDWSKDILFKENL